jgi:hypothetical protein
MLYVLAMEIVPADMTEVIGIRIKMIRNSITNVFVKADFIIPIQNK